MQTYAINLIENNYGKAKGQTAGKRDIFDLTGSIKLTGIFLISVKSCHLPRSTCEFSLHLFITSSQYTSIHFTPTDLFSTTRTSYEVVSVVSWFSKQKIWSAAGAWIFYY